MRQEMHHCFQKSTSFQQILISPPRYWGKMFRFFVFFSCVICKSGSFLLQHSHFGNGGKMPSSFWSKAITVSVAKWQLAMNTWTVIYEQPAREISHPLQRLSPTVTRISSPDLFSGETDLGSARYIIRFFCWSCSYLLPDKLHLISE